MSPFPVIPPLLAGAMLAFGGMLAAQEAESGSPRHPPRDTVPAAQYQGWQQYSLQCARCHGDDALGTSFAPNLVNALKPDGDIPDREAFLAVLAGSRAAKGMPSAATLGVDAAFFDGMYQYLRGRSEGRLKGGRPAKREE